MAYPGVDWENKPSTRSPINATNLEIMDNGIMENDKAISELGTALEYNTDAIEDEMANVYTKDVGTNLYDPHDEETGSLKADGTIDSTATAYRTTPYVRINKSTDYAISTYANNNSRNTSRKYIALYDKTLRFVSGTYQNVNGQAIVTFNSGEAYYARFSFSSPGFVLAKGSTTPSTFTAYSAKYISKLEYPDNSIPVSAIQDGFVEKELINLYNSENDVDGFISSIGGLDISSSYKTTEYIPIESGIKYRIEPGFRYMAFYTAPVYTSYVTDSRFGPETSTYEFTSQITGYMRVSYAVGSPLTKISSISAATVNKKIQEGIALSNTQVEQIKEEVNAKSILTGKKWVVCGDSFTNSGGTGTTISSGKYAGQNYTYPWIIGNDDRQDMTIVKFFEGGRTLAFPAVPDTFTNSLTCPTATWYYQNIPEDADYITIYLGINDEHHATGGGDGEDPTGYIPLGTIDDNTTDSYLGAWNVVLTWLITNRPNAHIGIIVSNGIAGNDNYRQGQIAIAKKYGIPYIDLNGDQITPAMLRTSNPNIPASIKSALIQKWAVNPGVNEHPNDAAQLFESTVIENFLMRL